MLGTGGTQAAELGALAFALTAVLVPVARRVAVRLDVMSHPKDDRWHSHATPYLGGAAMAVAAATCIALSPERDSHAAVLILGILVVAAIGLADDLHPLHPLLRVGLEAGVAVLAYSVGIRVELVGDAGDAVITVLWLVGIANAFNLLDNADGALGSVCTVIGSGVAVAAALQGQTLVAVFAGVLVGVSAGFLLFNWPPATIFMGDTGSLFLGFVVAAAILDLQTAGTSGAGAVAAVLLAGGAIFDTTFVLLDRAIGRRSLWKGNTDHTAHRLLRAGVPPAATAAVLAAGTAWSAGWGLVLARDVVSWWLAAPAVVVPGLSLMALLLRLPAGADDGHPVPPEGGRHAKIT